MYTETSVIKRLVKYEVVVPNFSIPIEGAIFPNHFAILLENVYAFKYALYDKNADVYLLEVGDTIVYNHNNEILEIHELLRY